MKAVPQNYKTAKLVGGAVIIEDKPFPKEKLTPNSLAIKIFYTGICRADVKEVVGARDIMEDRGPLFGHEIVGAVIYAGENTEFKEDQLVTFNPNVTPNRTTGFAEYFFVEGDKDVLGSTVINIPDSVPIDPPWMPEPFATIIHSISVFMKGSRLADLKNKSVVIIGAGNSGVITGQLAKFLGAQVTLFNRGQMRVDFAKNNRLFSESELRRLDSYSDQQNLFDIAVVAPTIIDKKVLQIAYELVKEGGRIHLYGGTRSGDTFLESETDIDAIRRKERLVSVNYKGKNIHLSGAYGSTKEDFEEAFRLYKNYREVFPLSRLVSKVITLEELPSVITPMATGEKDFPGKVIVKI